MIQAGISPPQLLSFLGNLFSGFENLITFKCNFKAHQGAISTIKKNV
jgi:hypothetical protein